jgi:hypothetical protein
MYDGVSQMARFEYRCKQDGLVELTRPVGTAPPSWPCPVCGADMPRIFGAPMLSHADRRLMSAIDRSKQSADAPEVVTSLPPKRSPKRARVRPENPALRRLPRP